VSAEAEPSRAKGAPAWDKFHEDVDVLFAAIKGQTSPAALIEKTEAALARVAEEPGRYTALDQFRLHAARIYGLSRRRGGFAAQQESYRVIRAFVDDVAGGAEALPKRERGLLGYLMFQYARAAIDNEVPPAEWAELEVWIVTGLMGTNSIEAADLQLRRVQRTGSEMERHIHFVIWQELWERESRKHPPKGLVERQRAKDAAL
jgi:hypothetical protein